MDKSYDYNFFENLSRFFGIPNASANVKQPWNLPNGAELVFTEMSDTDVREQNNREYGRNADTPGDSMHWKKVPFSYKEILNDAGTKTKDHSGYFIVPAWNNVGDGNYIVESVVLDDDKKMSYEEARQFFDKISGDNRYQGFSMGEVPEPISNYDRYRNFNAGTSPNVASPAEVVELGETESTAAPTESAPTEAMQQKGFLENLAEFFGSLFR